MLRFLSIAFLLPLLNEVHCFQRPSHQAVSDWCMEDQHHVRTPSLVSPQQRPSSSMRSQHQQQQRMRPRSNALFAEKERLNFVSEMHVSSEALPSTDRSEVDAFLQSTACRNHFLSGGGHNAIRDEIRTPELEANWQRACETHYGSQYGPAPDDGIVSTETSLQFPGLRLVNRVYSGVKLVLSTASDIKNDNSSREYQTVLIGEQRQAFGPAPLVWVYNQLTGENKKKQTNGKESNTETGESNGYARTRIYVVEEKEEMQSVVCYKIGFDCTVQVLVQFPRFLMKILPVSQAKMEEQGSLSVQKAVEKDVIRAINGTSEAFQKWKSETAMSIL